MTWQLETVSSTPSFLRNAESPNPVLSALDFFQIDLQFGNSSAEVSADLRFLNDLVMRILHRGTGTMPSFAVESVIAESFGRDFGLRRKPSNGIGILEWQWQHDPRTSLNSFTDCLEPWGGDSAMVSFDPTHPENERRLFQQLLDNYGPRFASCVFTQVHISDLLPAEEGLAFQGQRVDFLLAFPNGRRLVLEPGDHEAGPNPIAQHNLDIQRDNALGNHGIHTIRIQNYEIGTRELIRNIDSHIRECGGHLFLNGPMSASQELLCQNHLFLLPTLIARVEHILSFFLLQRGMLSRDALRICIVEQDLECAELVLFSFFDRLRRLSTLYGISCPTPPIDLTVIRSEAFSCADLNNLRHDLQTYQCSVQRETVTSEGVFDLVIDAAIKSNNLTPAVSIAAECKAIVRNTFPHSHHHRFSYSSLPRPAHFGDDPETLITSFLKDFFRKEHLRDGQFPIIRNILSQKPTIGLLPTSAGKSICYQLASILTPGITFVVDPIVFLMKDQVLSLSEQYGITNIAAWSADARIQRDEQIGELMATNIMIFMSPERFLRPSFRNAMIALLAGDLYVNYAVIDEAHCVSMWGHDFRPPYLMLERCFREYCTFRSRAPVVIALTGTASQLVLIDLKRELRIEEFEAIVRPKSFDRAELTYNVIPCPSGSKFITLKTVFNTIANRIVVNDVRTDAWGILFAHYPKQVWDLYGDLEGDANDHITQFADGYNLQGEISCGIACGGMPQNTQIGNDVWKKYKDRMLTHFKHGRVRLLIGNAAIGVGIDNEHLNYVIAYCTPSSLESLGQQWGRAGRRGQSSQCYLIASDDRPLDTDNWLNGQVATMPRRYDDIGTVAYFHSQSFPGESLDIDSTLTLNRDLWRAEQDADGRRLIHGGVDERIQRYLSFLVMIGLVEDYTVTGMNANTNYQVKIHPEIDHFMAIGDQEGVHNHLVISLKDYLSRYRPTTEDEVLTGLQNRNETHLSSKAIGYLIHFIYNRIAYQRKESIRTIVGFCRERDLSSKAIRVRMKGFFDRNPKFSDRLDAMADIDLNINVVIEIVRLIEGYDDVEHLYWETRRLLDERFRADWATINMYAAIYRERVLSSSSRYIFQLIMDELRERLLSTAQQSFLSGFLNSLVILDKALSEKVSNSLLPEFFIALYEHYHLEYLSILDTLTCEPDVKDYLRALIGIKQMEGILHVVKSKHSLG